MLKGRTIYHCHGKNKGKPYRRYSSKRKAEKAHRAIMAKRKGGTAKALKRYM